MGSLDNAALKWYQILKCPYIFSARIFKLIQNKCWWKMSRHLGFWQIYYCFYNILWSTLISDSIQAHIQPPIVVTMPNSNIEFQCILNIIANFTWLLNGRLLGSKNFTFQTTSGSLLLREIHKSLEGQITCVASSNMGIFAASADLIIGGMHLYL